jgi:tetraacyldisaccharide 4'-kinase
VKARRSWAWPLVPVYRAALALKDGLRRMGWLRVRRLGWPVVSVGSLSAGGAGKTPVVIALARVLAEHGCSSDVLSRGYGREGKEVELVLPDGDKAARHFGDEPVLIVERTAAPVWVGADRYAAGTAAEAFRQDQERAVHLLDDGFQHRQLARDFDVVLVTAEDLDDALLPAGNLREPPGALRRADAVVVREDEQEAVTKRVRALLREGTPVWTVRRQLRFPAPLGVFGAGLRPLAFCAIARPEGFVAMLKAAGCGVVDAVVFRDHAVYGEREIEQVVRFAQELKATGLVTTEKDAVKLPTDLRARMEREVGPVMVVPLQAEFVYRAPVWRALEARLGLGAQMRAEEQRR